MSKSQIERPLKRAPTHPGELMREILREHVEMPIAEAARRMEISRQALYDVLRGEARVTAEMALRFGKLVDAAPELYLRMQDNFDLWQARRKLTRELARIEPARNAAGQ